MVQAMSALITFPLQADEYQVRGKISKSDAVLVTVIFLISYCCFRVL